LTLFLPLASPISLFFFSSSPFSVSFLYPRISIYPYILTLFSFFVRFFLTRLIGSLFLFFIFSGNISRDDRDQLTTFPFLLFLTFLTFLTSSPRPCVWDPKYTFYCRPSFSSFSTRVSAPSNRTCWIFFDSLLVSFLSLFFLAHSSSVQVTEFAQMFTVNPTRRRVLSPISP
jgi:hypothetical protein